MWRLPPGSKRGPGGGEGPGDKSEEDVALEKEAAEAIMRGKGWGQKKKGGGYVCI